MKKIALLLALALIISACLAGCRNEEEQNNMKTTANKNSVQFINQAADADIWILPQTEENLKTTVWGTATVQGTVKDEVYSAPLCEAGDGGKYIFRMIDADGYYYSADGVKLENGCVVLIKGEACREVTLQVTDKTGSYVNYYDVFSAKL